MNVMNTYSIRVMTKRWGRVALGNRKLGREARAHSSAEASEPEAFASPQVLYCGVFVGSVVARRAASCPFQPPVPRAFRRMDGTALLWFITLPPALFYLSVSRFRATAKRTRTTTVFKCHRVCATDSAERHDGHHFPLLLIPHIFFWNRPEFNRLGVGERNAFNEQTRTSYRVGHPMSPHPCNTPSDCADRRNKRGIGWPGRP